MSGPRLRVAPIVEGHGEVSALPRLLRRIGKELLDVEFIDVLPANRKRRDRLVGDIGGELRRAVDEAARVLSAGTRAEDPSLILVLIDADDGCAAAIAGRILSIVRPGVPVACVVAVKEYETWFVAAAESLGEYLDLREGDPPADPEGQRCGKRWIEQRFLRGKYSATVDQPRLTARMDLRICRERCPSFDKLCRELEKALASAEP